MRRTTLVLALAAATIAPAAATNHYTKITDVRVAMSDGVLLAADVYVPTAADQDGDGLYPCVVELTPYRKESRSAEGASFLPTVGVALIEVDARGTGGSEGEYDVVFSVREQADAAEWVEWAAAKAEKPEALGGGALCEDEVGMYGGSYSGIIQYLVASLPDAPQGDLPARPEHLAAIAPQRAYGDLYRDIVYHGGQVIGSFGTIWSTGTTAYYTEPATDVQTQDGRDAWLDHLQSNDPMMVPYLSNQYADATFTSDDTTPAYTQKLYEDSSALPRIGNLRVPTLHLAGWFDAFTRGQLLTFQRALELERSLADGRGPNFLIVGPWNHSGTHFITPDQGFRPDLADWYHWWLEGREAGLEQPEWIAGGARVRYFQMLSGRIVPNGASLAEGDGEWLEAESWPPPEATVDTWYLQPGGGLSRSLPPLAEFPDTYVANPGAGNGEILSRWDNAAGTPQPQWDQRMEGPAKGLTFTTDRLDADVRIAGPIAFTLYAAVNGQQGAPSAAAGWPGLLQQSPPYLDTDFVVKLSDVADDGSAMLVTQGYLRASHRAVDEGRNNWFKGVNLGPYHPHTLATLDPPERGVVDEYRIEIWPTAKTFAAGHRIRIDVYSADTPGHLTIVKPVLNSVWSSVGGSDQPYTSRLEMAVLPS